MFASFKQRPLWQRIAIIAGVIFGLLAVIGGVVYWLVVPGMAAKVVRERLASVEERTALKVDFDEVNTSGLSGVTITGIRVSDANGEKLVTLAEASAGLDTGALLSGDRHISSIDVSGMELTVRRHADGQTNLEQTLDKLRGEESEDSTESESGDSDGPPGFMRPFGGQFPDVEASNSRIVFVADEGAKPWAVDEISTEHFQVDSSGETAEFGGTIQITRGKGRANWQLPETMKVTGQLALPLKSSDLKLEFEKPILISGLPPEPMIRAGFSGLEIKDGGIVVVEGIDLALQGPTEATPLASIGRVEVSVNEFTTNLSELRVLKIAVKEPVVRIDRSYQGGSGWNDLWELSRGQTARRIIGKSHAIARRIAVENELEVEPRDSGSSLMARLESVNWNDLLANRAPQSIIIEGLEVSIQDNRPLALLKPRRELSLEKGTLDLSHRALQGEISVKGSFEAKGEKGADLGRAEGEISWSYRSGMLDLDVGLEGLHLGWLVQLSGRPIDSELRAGVMHVDLKAERQDRDSKLSFDGLFSLEDASIHLESVTEKPITSLDTSYTFAGYYDPDAEIPEPQLLPVRSYLVDEPRTPAGKPKQEQKDDASADTKEEDEEPKPPRRGAFVFTKGSGLLNGIKATFKPALYGLEAGLRPSRFDVEIELPKTPVMEIFKAVPDAIKGPLVGTEMKGTYAWNFRAEVPLYEAGDMEWKAKKNLQNFELVSMPKEVDVRRMRGAMTHTIVDERIEFERTIELPEMRPVPLQWLVDNTDLPKEEFVERRVEREWPPRNPQSDEWQVKPRRDPFASERETKAPADEQGLVGTPPDGETTPRETPKKRRESKAMVKWKGKEKPHPYGPYRYVPLHHISPWLTRAVMTTEDNSFFEHGGFNWYALKESVEDNLDAGGFVRGASTVSMQLVKNLFLSRDKVISRKLREVFMVWLMEDMVDIPKSRILELYFNIIEFGPGIFGINDASVHYFGKRPANLSITEVAWLVSIIPNPKKYHFYYERGEISDAWFRRMMRYVEIMRNRHRATDADVEWARNHKPEFYKPGKEGPMLREKKAKARFGGNWFGLGGFGGEAPNSDDGPMPKPEPVPLEGTAEKKRAAEEQPPQIDEVIE